MFKIACIMHVYVPLSLFSSLLVRVHAEDPQSNTDSTTAVKKPFFICSESVDFQIVHNQSRALQAFDILMRTSFSVEAILLLRYTKSSTFLRRVLFRVSIAPS